MDLELDDVVEDLLNLGVQFFAQGVGAKGQLFESRRAQSAYRNRPLMSPILSLIKSPTKKSLTKSLTKESALVWPTV